MKLSVVMPAYNEKETIREIVARVKAVPIDKEIVIVDDGSTDGTREILAELDGKEGVRVLLQPQNRGKGAAIARGFAEARGDLVIIQDADLEYDPDDIPAVIAPILDGHADAVCGTRFGGGGAHRVLYFYHSLGNGALTWMSNMFTNLNLTDMEVGYKAFTHETFRIMHLTRERFGIEPEIVARLAQMGARVYEVPISYHGRTYAEGKKITWRDGLAAFWHIVVASWTSNSQPRLIR
jgi:glycosyltransferase involved in cell wall biosynthesis